LAQANFARCPSRSFAKIPSVSFLAMAALKIATLFAIAIRVQGTELTLADWDEKSAGKQVFVKFQAPW